MGAGLARVCVGLGLLWILFVLFLGLVDGNGQPARLFALLDPFIGDDARAWIFRGLTFAVVPIGMLVFLLDVLRDPLPLWARAAAPGLFAAIYALFLAAAVPEIGQDLLRIMDPVAGLVLSPDELSTAPAARLAWLARFGAAVTVLAVGPAILGGLAALAAGPRRPRRP